MLGEFFGLPGVVVVGLQLDTVSFKRLCRMMNNSLDVYRLTKFKRELEYLKFFLQDKVKVEYSDPEIKKLYRKANFVRTGDFERVERFYKEDISGMNKQQLEELANTIISEAESLAKTKGVPQAVVNSFRTRDDKKISLAEHELSIISNYKENMITVINSYQKSALTGNFEESLLFGKKLHEIASRTPKYLLSVVDTMFRQPGADTDALAKHCLVWADALESHFEVREEAEDNTGLVKEFTTLFDFEAYVLRSEGLNPQMQSFEDLSESGKTLFLGLESHAQQFEKLMLSLIERGSLDKSSLRVLVNLFFECSRMDYDMEYVKGLLFPELAVLSPEELDSVYNNLNSVGFFFFNRMSCRLMLESLKRLSFASETKTIIDPQKEEGKFTFARAVEDIRYLCYSLRPVGSPVEEVGS